MNPISVNSIIENFPIKTLPPTEGLPSYASLAALKKQLSVNAASISSQRGAGTHGYLGIVLSDAVYATIANAAFDVPVFPGLHPDVIQGSAAVIAEHVREHKENTREWREYQNVHSALKQQLINSIDDVYLSALSDEYVGYSNCTLRELLTYLFTTYGLITSQDLEDNETRLKQPWDPNQPFQVLILQIEKARDFADHGGVPYSPMQILNYAHKLVYQTGLYFDELKIWDSKTAADKTWATFKTFIATAQQTLRNQQLTMKKAGYPSANFMYQPMAQQEEAQALATEQANALANFAAVATSDRATVAALTSTITDLTKQLAAAQATIAASQATILSLR